MSFNLLFSFFFFNDVGGMAVTFQALRTQSMGWCLLPPKTRVCEVIRLFFGPLEDPLGCAFGDS